MVKAFREGRENIGTQERKREWEYVFRGKKPYLSLLRTPNNVQLEWASKRQQAMMKAPPSNDKTEDGTTQVEIV